MSATMGATVSAITPSPASPTPWLGRLPTWLRQFGWPGLLGAGLLLACAWFIQLELPQRREAVAQGAGGAAEAGDGQAPCIRGGVGQVLVSCPDARGLCGGVSRRRR